MNSFLTVVWLHKQTKANLINYNVAAGRLVYFLSLFKCPQIYLFSLCRFFVDFAYWMTSSRKTETQQQLIEELFKANTRAWTSDNKPLWRWSVEFNYQQVDTPPSQLTHKAISFPQNEYQIKITKAHQWVIDNTCNQMIRFRQNQQKSLLT